VLGGDGEISIPPLAGLCLAPRANHEDSGRYGYGQSRALNRLAVLLTHLSPTLVERFLQEKSSGE
jgi:hypothetical protein